MSDEPKNGSETPADSRQKEDRRHDERGPPGKGERQQGQRRRETAAEIDPRVVKVARALCRAVGKDPDDPVGTGRTLRTRGTSGVLLQEEKVPCWQDRDRLDEARKFVAAFDALSSQDEPQERREKRGESRRKVERRQQDRGVPAEGERRKRDRRKDERRKP
jgi:hypothetical protein